MDAELGLEHTHQGAPQAGSGDGCQSHRDEVDHRRELDAVANHDCCHHAHDGLALSADIEHTGLEGEGDAQSGEDERCGPDDHLDNILGFGKNAADHRSIGSCRIVARNGQDNGSDNKAHHDRDQDTGDRPAKCFFELFHHFFPPAIRRPMWFSSAFSASMVSTIVPS